MRAVEFTLSHTEINKKKETLKTTYRKRTHKQQINANQGFTLK